MLYNKKEGLTIHFCMQDPLGVLFSLSYKILIARILSPDYSISKYKHNLPETKIFQYYFFNNF